MEYSNPNLNQNTINKLKDIEKQFIFMRASGSSIRDIAKKLNKSTNTICAWNKKFSDRILLSRNRAFCELQKKVIELKYSRIDFLKKEIERLIKVLSKCDIEDDSPASEYENFFERFTKLSDTLTAYENDVLSIGLNFKDNISPEADVDTENADDNNAVAKDNNGDTAKTVKKTAEKTVTNSTEKQNRNTATLPPKYFFYKQ
jgi:transposase